MKEKNNNSELVKNRILEVVIESLAEKGDGVARYHNMTIYIPRAMPQETCSILITKVHKEYAYAKLLEVKNKSEQRETPLCPIFNQCGGCQLQHLNKAAESQFKTELLESQFQKSDKQRIRPVIQAEESYYYRNKAQFAIQKQGDQVVMGLYARHSHRVIDLDQCAIQSKGINSGIQKVRDYLEKTTLTVYDEARHTGQLRYVVIREGRCSKELMVALVVKEAPFHEKEEWIDALKETPNIKSIMVNYNPDKTDRVLGRVSECIWGDSEIQETILGNTMLFSLDSFVQLNPKQMEVLYHTIIELAQFNQTETVWDLYSGIGSIAMSISGHVQKVIAIEEVEAATDNARKNAKLNKLENITVYQGKVEEKIQDIKEEPDCVIMDPPRKGCEESVLKELIKRGPKRIIYVSCNPVTLTKDCAILSVSYDVQEVQPVDMFPQTYHLETITYLSKRRQ